MRKFQTIMMWMSLACICLLAVLSIVGAFLGAERAAAMFASAPLVVLWLVMLALLVAGLAAFPRLVSKPGLLAMHIACLLILAGGLFGSRGGHRIANRLFGFHKILEGYMLIASGGTDSRVFDESGEKILGLLGVDVRLEKVWSEF